MRCFNALCFDKIGRYGGFCNMFAVDGFATSLLRGTPSDGFADTSPIKREDKRREAKTIEI